MSGVILPRSLMALANPEPAATVYVSRKHWLWPGGGMSFLKRILGKAEPPKPRVRVCVECGMPVAEHKDWCSIYRGQLEMKAAQQATAPRS